MKANRFAPLFAVSPRRSPYRLPVWLDGVFAIATDGASVWAIAEAVAPAIRKPQLVAAPAFEQAIAAAPDRFDFTGSHLNGVYFQAASRRQFEQFPDLPDLDAFDFPEAFQIDLARLAGALKAAGERDVRYYLNGIAFDFAGHAIVATDGHRMHAWNSDTLPDIAARRPAIMPAEAAQLVLKAGATAITYADREVDGRIEGWFVAHYEGGTLVIKAIDAQYPDWRRPVPANLSAEPVTLNRTATIKAIKDHKRAAGRGKFSAFELAGRSYNADYLLQAIEAAPGDVDHYPGADERSAGVFVSGAFGAVIMPVRP